ncbi:MAG: transposase [Candidatus Helarchaeota archaeon]
MGSLYSVKLKRSSVLKWIKIYGTEYCQKSNTVLREDSEVASGHFGADGTFQKLKFLSDTDLKDKYRKKSGCALVISGRITGWELMCYLGRGEDQQEIGKFLVLLKKKLGAQPKSIVVNYKPAWDVAIKRVFPNTMIIRVGFHTVQLINRAILKSIQKLAKQVYSAPIRDAIKLYQLIKKDG